MINWTQGTNWDTVPGRYTVQDNYGSFHVYAFTMTMGVIIAILFSAWKFYKKDISLTQLAIGAAIIVPFSLFGASIFGKLNADGIGKNADGADFWGLFAFWNAGMAIHGGVYVGSAVGLIIFGIMSRRTKVSLWTYMDAIIPNILLGQAIGRFGNFFNHEVMGAPIAKVGEGTTWMPDWMATNMILQYHGPKESVITINGLTMTDGALYYMAPIFFYESMSLLAAWFIITFIIPNIGKWLGPKPWHRQPNEFNLSFNMTVKNIFMPWTFMSNKKLRDVTEQEYKNSKTRFLERTSHNPEDESYFVIWKQAYDFDPNFENKPLFKNYVNVIQNKNFSMTKKRYLIGNALLKSNNNDRYWVTKVGAEASAYFFAWNIIRFALELQRPYDHLFIMYEKTLSLSIIGATALIGLIGIILTQTIVPIFFRQPGFMYEKQFFMTDYIDKKWFGISRSNNVKPEKVVETKNKEVIQKKRLSKEEKAKAKLEAAKAKQANK